MKSVQRKIDTKFGPIYLTASEKGLQSVYFDQQAVPMETSSSNDSIKQILDRTQIQLEEYLDGRRKEFDLPMDVQGTIFQKHVWQQLTKIPYGETRSYKDIAIALNDKNASRAVGTANGKNPLSIIVPCHRVITTNGSLGGYSGGLNNKRKLLTLERSLGVMCLEHPNDNQD